MELVLLHESVEEHGHCLEQIVDASESDADVESILFGLRLVTECVLLVGHWHAMARDLYQLGSLNR